MPPRPQKPEKEPPIPHAFQVFDSFQRVPQVIAVGAAGPPQSYLGSNDTAEGTLTTEHEDAPVLLCPVNILLGKGQSSVLHFLHEERFQGYYPGPNLELVDNETVDMLQGNISHQRHLVFSIASSGMQVYLHKSLQDIQATTGDGGKTFRVIFSLRRDVPSLGKEAFDRGAVATKAVDRPSLLSPRHNPCFFLVESFLTHVAC
jgi:hypothetical protein